MTDGGTSEGCSVLEVLDWTRGMDCKYWCIGVFDVFDVFDVLDWNWESQSMSRMHNADADCNGAG